MTTFLKTLLALAIVIAAALAAGAMIAAKPSPKQKVPAPAIPTVSVVSFLAGEVEIAVRGQAEVRSRDQIVIASDVPGRVVAIAEGFREGLILPAGEALLTLDDANYRLALAQAEFAHKDAELALADARSRYKSGGLPQVQRAEAQLLAARAQLKKARTDLARTRISTPQRALIRERNVSLGQFAGTGAVLAVLNAVEVAELHLPLTAAQAGLLMTSEQYPVTIADNSGNVWQGRLVRLFKQADAATRLLTALIEVNDPYGLETPGQPLRFGDFVRLTITGVKVSNALRIPVDALHENRFVFALQEGQLRRQAVTPLLYETETVVIRGDFEGPLQLVTTRLPVMAEGMAVAPE